MTDESHSITICPGLLWGVPTVDGHRIAVEQMAGVWWRGRCTLEIIEGNWPGMNRGAVLVACWYMARYGSRLWSKRWRDWLEIAERKLWAGDYITCPMPPQKVRDV